VKPERANLVEAASSLEVSVTEFLSSQAGRQGIGSGNRRRETDPRHESAFLLFKYQGVDGDEDSETVPDLQSDSPDNNRRQPELADSSSGTRDETNNTSEQHSPPPAKAFAATHGITTKGQNGKDKDDVLLLDCAATSHYLIPADAALSTDGQVRMDKGTRVQSARKANVQPTFKGRIDAKFEANGQFWVLYNTALLEDLDTRLLSVGAATDDGFSSLFTDQHCLVFKDGLPFTTVAKVHGIYPIAFPSSTTSMRATAMRHGLQQNNVEHSSNHSENIAEPLSTSESANFARVLLGFSNLREQLHIRCIHATITPSSHLDKLCATTFDKAYNDRPHVECEICLLTKAHRHPYPRRTAAERQARSGDGPHGSTFVETFSGPYPGERGERESCHDHSCNSNRKAVRTQSCPDRRHNSNRGAAERPHHPRSRRRGNWCSSKTSSTLRVYRASP
jgi:hypothetical protein